MNKVIIQVMFEFMQVQRPSLTDEMWKENYYLLTGPWPGRYCCSTKPSWRKYKEVFDGFVFDENHGIFDIHVASWYNCIYKPGSKETSAKKIMDALELESLKWKVQELLKREAIAA
jgi:hypothetical protein